MKEWRAARKPVVMVYPTPFKEKKMSFFERLMRLTPWNWDGRRRG